FVERGVFRARRVAAVIKPFARVVARLRATAADRRREHNDAAQAGNPAGTRWHRRFLLFAQRVRLPAHPPTVSTESSGTLRGISAGYVSARGECRNTPARRQ